LATDCSVSLKFGTEFEHVTGDTLHPVKVKVKGAKVNITV